jgi:succinyl-CoA synthetase alpha subunit
MTDHSPNDQFRAQVLMFRTGIEYASPSAAHRMDHGAGIMAGGKGDAESKIEAMKRVGIVMADSPAGLGQAVMRARGGKS